MNEIICGDALATLKTLQSGIVQTCVTSPPYFGLRDYGVPGQIGLEDTPELYIARLVEVFREVKRVLRDDGTLWVNMGDSYATGGTGGKPSDKSTLYLYGRHGPSGRSPYLDSLGESKQREVPDGLKPKDLIGIPWMLAFALRADGWYLRSDIIWHKPNCMPESVDDRPTKAHEYIFLLSKSERYFYDADAIRETYAREYEPGMGVGNSYKIMGFKESQTGLDRNGSGQNGLAQTIPNPSGRNKRSVWTVSTRAYEHAHFATFPPKLIEPCILAGTSPRACEHCGSPWERVTERGEPVQQHWAPNTQRKLAQAHGVEKYNPASLMTTGTIRPHLTIGWQPTCTHDNTGSGSCIVLDPFMGAGTVALVALEHHRQYIGIELNAAYVELINKRIHTIQPHLWEVPA